MRRTCNSLYFPLRPRSLAPTSGVPWTMTSSRAWVLVLVAALAACKSRDSASRSDVQLQVASQSPGAAPAEPPAPVDPPADGVTSLEEADRHDENRPARPRKIVRTGTLSIEVDDYQRARAAIDGLVRGAGGFVASVDVARMDGSVGAATLVVRVPEERLDAAVAALSELGTLRRESLRAEDVSETYYDLAARLRNGKRLEERMVELAAKAGGVKDLLEVEREIGRVRESIEVMEGQMRGLDDRTSLATLTVEVVTRETYVAVEEPGLGGKIERAFDTSVRGLGSAAEALLLFMVTVLPWLVPVGAGAWFLRRRLRQRV
jgi:hypothetical protein